jgi:hypothetical protein
MRLDDIRAISHAAGQRIDLSWRNADPAGFPGVRVVRRERTHPRDPLDGVVIAEGLLTPAGTDAHGRALFEVSDTGLRGNTVYYYALIPYHDDPPVYSIESANRTSALATAHHGAGERMYELLPALYRRYDGAAGHLRALLELPGGELDLLHGFARALLGARDIERVDGALLPLLAEWIGWNTDHRLDVARQRSEVRGAPAVYQRVGLMPVIGATIKRISGWESRSKEFVHNVARSNRPPLLNLWARHIAADGTPVTLPGDALDTLISLDGAHEGRPAVVTDDHGIRWLFYHTQRRGAWRLTYKTTPTFRLDAGARVSLAAGDVARVQQEFAAAGVDIAGDAVISVAGDFWHVDDATNAERYVIPQTVDPAASDDSLTVYHTSASALEPGARASLLSPSFAPSVPVNSGALALPRIAGTELDEKDPAAVLQGDTLWLFWSSYDRDSERWHIRYRTRRDGAWSPMRDRLWEAPAQDVPERRAPAALVDAAGGLWLFWLERRGRRWQLRYNRHDGSGLALDPSTGWELAEAAVFPDDGGADPRVESDPFVLLHPTAANRRIWLFWARREATGDPGQTRWSIAYRTKAGIDPTAADWSAIETVPKPDVTVHDREPAARVADDGDVVLFWSGDRTGGWSIWHAALDPAVVPDAWTAAAQVTTSAYAQRSALPVPLDGDTLLLYRSSESLSYASDIYRATSTVDFRYAGSTTPQVRDAAKLGLRGAFDDFQHYTFDAQTSENDWYRRDTIGVYLAPDTMDGVAIARGVERLANVLPEFMPVTDRAVFIANSEMHVDHVYTYDTASAAPSFIGESHSDALTMPAGDDVLDTDTDFEDDLT